MVIIKFIKVRNAVPKYRLIMTEGNTEHNRETRIYNSWKTFVEDAPWKRLGYVYPTYWKIYNPDDEYEDEFVLALIYTSVSSLKVYSFQIKLDEESSEEDEGNEETKEK